MPTKRMLIDAAHPEETRVVVIDGSRLEEYDVEVASRRQLKGNIYLAKITRVEPSLQAAFVDYGGNRHGFLAFNEIHPDYYQIPVADRERLLAEEVALAREAEARAAVEDGDDAAVDDDDDLERRHLRSPSRHYKIQEVIKRRQIMLVQVAKEERGNKGAALTTYLSLAGRYCVLMPNTARGGGISRKITNTTDRKRLKKILAELEVPEGMAVIVRTAGAGRSKSEIKRDYEYLIRLWSSIRETTLGSTAPNLVYEEGSLIKRSIRDHYERDIEEIIIQGEPEYRIAREFMKLFIPSHAKRVKLYEEAERPLLQAFNVEDQLDAMHQPVVQLRSGGYLVINPTEALVTIDVNSGRATRERHIEETALRTNLEASDEIGRQLRLRDLAGLIVIDFIDMEVPRNQGLVERRLKDAMKGDRARTQIGRISPFGLLELSRQRLRPSLLETSFEICAHCRGSGVRRSTESTALAVLRKIEEEGSRHRAAEINVSIPPAVATYLLNHKRRSLVVIEDRFDIEVSISADDSLIPPDCRIERLRLAGARTDEPTVSEAEEEVATEETTDAAAEKDDAAKRGRRRRGRRRRRPEEEQLEATAALDPDVDLAETEMEAVEEEPAEEEDDLLDVDESEETRVGSDAEQTSEPGKKRRRRGKRGGRRRSKRIGDRETTLPEAADLSVDETGEGEPVALVDADHDDDDDDDSFDTAWMTEEYDDDREEPSAEDLVPVDPGAPSGEIEASGQAAEDAEAPRAKRPRSRRRPSRARTAEDAVDAASVEAAEAAITSGPDTDAVEITIEQVETSFVPDYRDRAVTGEMLVDADPAPDVVSEPPAATTTEADAVSEPPAATTTEADAVSEPLAATTTEADTISEPAVETDAKYVAESDFDADLAPPPAAEPVQAVESAPEFAIEPVPVADPEFAAETAPAAQPWPEPQPWSPPQLANVTIAEEAVVAVSVESEPGEEPLTEEPLPDASIAPEPAVPAAADFLGDVVADETPAPAEEPDRLAGTSVLPQQQHTDEDDSHDERLPHDANAGSATTVEDLRRTEVIHVGENSEEDRSEARRGWWSRFLT